MFVCTPNNNFIIVSLFWHTPFAGVDNFQPFNNTFLSCTLENENDWIYFQRCVYSMGSQSTGDDRFQSQVNQVYRLTIVLINIDQS